MKLYRPIGIFEWEKIVALQQEAFPPRFVWQPIFYPVLNAEYAAQIAHDWNTKDENSGFCGLVTAFEIDDAYIAQYEVQCVGGNIHLEYWIPAEELATFNQHIQGKIQIIEAFYGAQFVGEKPF
jgi:hypothetical protein